MIAPPHFPPGIGEIANQIILWLALFGFPTLFLLTCRAQTPWPISTLDGSKYVVRRKEVPFVW